MHNPLAAEPHQRAEARGVGENPATSRWHLTEKSQTPHASKNAKHGALDLLPGAPGADFAPGAFDFFSGLIRVWMRLASRLCPGPDKSATYACPGSTGLSFPPAKSSKARSRPLNSRASKRRSRYNSRKYSSAGRSPLLELHSTQQDTRLR